MIEEFKPRTKKDWEMLIMGDFNEWCQKWKNYHLKKNDDYTKNKQSIHPENLRKT